MAAKSTARRGHAGIKATLNDMVDVLPPESPNKPDYMRIHTTFGLMQGCIKNAETSANPEKQYRELQKLEEALRKRLIDLKAKKGVPEKMRNCLDELRDAVKEALEQGIDVDFLIKSYEDMVVAPEASLAERESRRPEKMISEKRFKKVWDDLKEEKAKNAKLNREFNEMAMRLKRVEAELNGMRGQQSPNQGRRRW